MSAGARSGPNVRLVPRPAADLNVTPLVDVLLVLLVIFMAALPLTQKGLDSRLPPQAPPGVERPGTMAVDVAADRRIRLNGEEVSRVDLDTRLRAVFRSRSDKTLFVSGSSALRYRDIVEVIDVAKGAWVAQVGIVTPPR